MRRIFGYSAVMVCAASLCVMGCSNSPNDASSDMHAPGYKDTPPAPSATPSDAAAPGVPAVNGPVNQIPVGGVTSPTAAQNTPEVTHPNDTGH